MAKELAGRTFGKYTGYLTIVPFMVNPSLKDKEVLGFKVEGKEEPSYKGTNKEGIPQTRATFFYTIKGVENYQDNFSIFLTKEQESMGKVENGLLGWIDDNGVINYGATIKEARESAIDRGFAAIDLKSARPLYKGEKDLLALYTGLTKQKIVFDEADMNILFEGTDKEIKEFLTLYFIKKDKKGNFLSTGAIVGFNVDSGNTVIYKLFGTLAKIKDKFEKYPFKAYYPEDYEMKLVTKEELLDKPENEEETDDFKAEEETDLAAF